KCIGAYARDHANRITEPCHGHSLIRALPTRVHLKVATVNGLPCEWNSLRPGDQVDVDAPNHDNRFPLHGHREPPYRTGAQSAAFQPATSRVQQTRVFTCPFQAHCHGTLFRSSCATPRRSTTVIPRVSSLVVSTST